MNELFELIEKLKEERSISSGTQDVFKKFIGKEYEANLAFISASRTFSLRYDDSYSLPINFLKTSWVPELIDLSSLSFSISSNSSSIFNESKQIKQKTQ